jgi:hypothetical protein
MFGQLHAAQGCTISSSAPQDQVRPWGGHTCLGTMPVKAPLPMANTTQPTQATFCLQFLGQEASERPATAHPSDHPSPLTTPRRRSAGQRCAHRHKTSPTAGTACGHPHSPHARGRTSIPASRSPHKASGCPHSPHLVATSSHPWKAHPTRAATARLTLRLHKADGGGRQSSGGVRGREDRVLLAALRTPGMLERLEATILASHQGSTPSKRRCAA